MIEHIKDANESLNKNSTGSKTVDKSKPSVDKVIDVQRPARARRKSTGKGRGGARPGAGRPKGKMEPRTIEKMHIKKEFEDRVAHHANTLFNAQLTLALGAQFLVARYRVKTAKGYRWTRFERVTDPDIILQYLDGDFKDSKDEYYMITAEKPDAHAIDSLLDRAFGKAPQNLNIKDDRPDPIASVLKKFGLLEEEDEDAGEVTGSSETPPKSPA